MEEAIRDLIDELERQVQDRKTRDFHSTLNQPNLIAVNSTNALDKPSANGFTNFSVNLPRPVLQTESIQLVNANIPQCVPNIPDTACGFWYYRLSTYAGNVPSLNNLFYVRLLPSYYKKEFIQNPQIYGFNQTYDGYTNLETQLALSCVNDLGYKNYLNTDALFPYFQSQYCPRDVSITYDPDVNKFKMTGLNAFSPPAMTVWDTGMSFVVGDRVLSNGPLGIQISWLCIQANTDEQPEVGSIYWVADNQPVVAIWSATTTYGIGRIVRYNGIFYRSIAVTTNNAPNVSPTYWDDDFTDFLWNRYLITGFDDPNVAIAQNTFYKTYDNYTLFEINEVIQYQGQFYLALQQSIGIPPNTDVAIWSLISKSITKLVGDGTTITINCDNSAGLFDVGNVVYIVDTENINFNSTNYIDPANPVVSYTVSAASATQVSMLSATVGTSLNGVLTTDLPSRMGLNDFSNQFDMNVLNNTVPIGIPAQLFSPNPKRILNSILGFTWNGKFTASTFANIVSSAVNVIPNTQTELFNRLRPVPYYFVEPVALGIELGDVPATSTQTYTADGYCNLVYSSILSIYASIVYGSTLDTQRNTGLLAMGTMNCGNLGVSFFNPVVNNPLKVTGSDIYSITFEFFDEFGDPYYFTNNAVISIVLKVLYNKV